MQFCCCGGWWTVWHLCLKESYRSSQQSPISRSLTASVVSSVLQLDSSGSCSLLFMKCWSFPFPQVSESSGICLAAFGHARFWEQIIRSKGQKSFLLVLWAESLCSLLIWKMLGQTTLLTRLSAKANQTKIIFGSEVPEKKEISWSYDKTGLVFYLRRKLKKSKQQLCTFILIHHFPMPFCRKTTHFWQ